MAELIPTITMEELWELSSDQLKELKSCEVEANGSYLFTFVNPQTDYIRVQTEYLCQIGNALSGKTIDEVLEEVEI